MSIGEIKIPKINEKTNACGISLSWTGITYHKLAEIQYLSDDLSGTQKPRIFSDSHLSNPNGYNPINRPPTWSNFSDLCSAEK